MLIRAWKISSHVVCDYDCRDLCEFDGGLSPAKREWVVRSGGANLGVIQATLVLESGISAKLREG